MKTNKRYTLQIREFKNYKLRTILAHSFKKFTRFKMYILMSFKKCYSTKLFLNIIIINSK